MLYYVAYLLFGSINKILLGGAQVGKRKSYFYGKPIEKLTDFEDFMEEQGFEDLETFKIAIKLMQSMNSVGVKYCAENQVLKDRWEKLKEWVIKENSHAGFFEEQKIQTLCEVEDKMQELEEE